MKKHVQTFLAGMLVLAPFAAVIYVVATAGRWLDSVGSSALGLVWPGVRMPPVVGALVVLAGIYLIGLLTRFWLFGAAVGLAEKLFRRVPGVKTVYESVRDLLKLFGGDSQSMGKAVLYRPPGTGLAMLAILTNEHPCPAAAGGEGLVCIYLPYAYMIGGPVAYVPREHIQALDMPVEQALRLCATAGVGASPEAQAAKSVLGRPQGGQTA